MCPAKFEFPAAATQFPEVSEIAFPEIRSVSVDTLLSFKIHFHIISSCRDNQIVG